MGIESEYCLCCYHIKCITSSIDFTEEILADAQHWLCHFCLTSIFPFNNIEEDLEFIGTIDDLSHRDTLKYISDKLFIPFELNDQDHSNLCDIDPDLNFYNSLNQLTSKCNCYLESSFNSEINSIFDSISQFYFVISGKAFHNIIQVTHKRQQCVSGTALYIKSCETVAEDKRSSFKYQ